MTARTLYLEGEGCVLGTEVYGLELEVRRRLSSASLPGLARESS